MNDEDFPEDEVADQTEHGEPDENGGEIGFSEEELRELALPTKWATDSG